MAEPVPTGVPPQLPEYHFQLVASFKLPLWMVKMVLLPAQIDVRVAEIVGTVGAKHVLSTTVDTTVTRIDQLVPTL